MEFDLRKAINAISDVVQNRPAPLREFEQIYMKVANMVVQAKYVARVFNGKNVVFVGDGDGIALSGLENFYGKNSPLRFRYVLEKPTLNPGRESDQLYTLKKFEVKNGRHN